MYNLVTPFDYKQLHHVCGSYMFMPVHHNGHRHNKKIGNNSCENVKTFKYSEMTIQNSIRGRIKVKVNSGNVLPSGP